MCEPTHVSRRAVTIPRPRWGVLYGVVFLGLVALTAGDFAAPPIARPALDGVLAVAALAGIFLWVRGNRTALDQQDWCACAADALTVRVIPSSRPRPHAPRILEPLDDVPAEESEEVWAVGASR